MVAEHGTVAGLWRHDLDQWQLRFLDGAGASARSCQDVIDIFNFFEDIPEEPMQKLVPWDWKKWSEYKASFLRNVKVPIHFAAFCGHIPLRLYVMGQDAWTRAARPTRSSRCASCSTTP